MAVKLFITPQEIASTTVLGGNVDRDKYVFMIESVQKTVIEPLLGTELYDKIDEDWTNDTLSGDYLTLFEKYIQPITKNEALAQYLSIASYTVANGGIYKHAPDNAEVVDKDEVETLAQKYHALAQVDIGRFQKWICKNMLEEYKTCQDYVNAQKDMTLTAGWNFGSNYKKGCDYGYDY